MEHLTTMIVFENDQIEELKKDPERLVLNIEAAMQNNSQDTLTLSIGDNLMTMESFLPNKKTEASMYLNLLGKTIKFGKNNQIGPGFLEVRKRFLKEAEKILEIERNEILKIEGKMLLTVDDFKKTPEIQTYQFGKYRVFIQNFIINIYKTKYGKALLTTKDPEEAINFLNNGNNLV